MSAPIWVPRPDVLADVELRWPGRSRAWDTVLLGRQLTNLGFSAHRQMGGGRFGVVVEGVWRGRRAVAKLDASPDCAACFGAAHALADAGISPRVDHVDVPAGVIVMGLVDQPESRHAGAPDPVRLGEMLRDLGRAKLRMPTGTPSMASFISPRISGDPVADTGRKAMVPTGSQLAEARGLLAQMPSSPHMIHGDVSAGNVLSGENRLWLIDQRGITGDPQFDAAIATWKLGYDGAARRSLIRAANADTGAVVAWERIARIARL